MSVCEFHCLVLPLQDRLIGRCAYLFSWNFYYLGIYMSMVYNVVVYLLCLPPPVVLLNIAWVYTRRVVQDRSWVYRYSFISLALPCFVLSLAAGASTMYPSCTVDTLTLDHRVKPASRIYMASRYLRQFMMRTSARTGLSGGKSARGLWAVRCRLSQHCRC